MSIFAPHLHRVVEDVLRDYGLFSPSALHLLLGTAAVESRLGTYLYQINGPALGVFQMEPATHDDIWVNYLQYRGGMKLALESEFGLAPAADKLTSDLRYAALMARIHYLRVPAPLPDASDLGGLAHYWKDHYNTRFGSGQPEHFIQAYIKLLHLE